MIIPFSPTRFCKELIESAQWLLPSTARFKVIWEDDLLQFGQQACFEELVREWSSDHP
jgi:hypothetical protein